MRQVLQKLDSLGGSYASKKYWAICYVPVKSKLQHPPGQPPGHLNFWKNFVQNPSPEAEKLFKCPIIGPFQVIKCPHPRGNFSVASITLRKLCM